MVNVDFHAWESTFEWMIVLPKQHYNNMEQIAKYAPNGVDRQSHLTHESLYNFGQEPYPTIKYIFVFLQGLGPNKHFSLAVGANPPSSSRPA